MARTIGDTIPHRCAYMIGRTSVEPMLRLLAAPEAYKHLIVLDADHLPKVNDIVRETLDWLDRYLGPVQ